MSRVLVVDDEPPLLDIVTDNLTARGFRVERATSGAGALAAAAGRMPDAVILDLGLPDMDGLSVIESLRAAGDVPIIVLSARADTNQKLAALDAGANDYVTKPFEMDELVARLRVALRSHPDPDRRSLGETGDYLTDLAVRRIQRGW